jgi:ferritin
MFSNNLETAINDQIKHEFYSAYLYLSMSAWAESHNMPGAAKWLGKQSHEEAQHAMKFYGIVHDRGGKVTLQAIPQPPTEWTSLLDAFQEVQKHEAQVTGLINRLYEMALKDNDYASQIALQWFVNEQVEEEKNAATIVEALKSVGTQGASLFMVDRWLGER